VVGAGSRVMPIDIDALYERNVKGLYSDIVDFVSRAQTRMTPEQANELFRLRAAGRDIVEAIKDTKHMHKNLVRYLASDNPYIRAEYNKIRLQLASVLRRLAEARDNADNPTAVLELDTLKLEMERNDTTANGMLESLIRDGRITPQMATSLMNDYTYAYDVTRNLVQMGEVLFATGDLAEKEAERRMTLDTDEVDEMITRDEGEP